MNFILPSNLKFECEFEFSKHLKRTKYLFAIYQTKVLFTKEKTHANSLLEARLLQSKTLISCLMNSELQNVSLSNSLSLSL
jgi:hypothetical protein